MLKRAVIGINPCNHYLPTVKHLHDEIIKDRELDFRDFQNMFMIAFKHMGDKVRLIDAVIANNVLSGKCHTATIDTFSNRYAILGNLHTIMPLKGKYVYVNHYHKMTQVQLDAIKEADSERNKAIAQAQFAQFQMLDGIKNQLKSVTKILKLLCDRDNKNSILNLFHTRKQMKKTRTMRNSCLATQYWEVKVGSTEPENVHAGFLDGTYDVNDIESIIKNHTIMSKMVLIDVDENIDILNKVLNDKTTEPLKSENIILWNNLLNLDRMYTQFENHNIDFNGDLQTIQTTNQKKIDLKLLVNIISKSQYDVYFSESSSSGGKKGQNKQTKNTTDLKVQTDIYDEKDNIKESYLEDLNRIYNEEDYIKELNSYDVTIIEINPAEIGLGLGVGLRLRLRLGLVDPAKITEDRLEVLVLEANSNRKHNYKYVINNNFIMETPTRIYDLLVKQFRVDELYRLLYTYYELDLLNDNKDNDEEMSKIKEKICNEVNSISTENFDKANVQIEMLAAEIHKELAKGLVLPNRKSRKSKTNRSRKAINTSRLPNRNSRKSKTNRSRKAINTSRLPYENAISTHK